MSSDVNFSGAFKRFVKGDADPINLFGLNPSRQDLRDNAANRKRRASQIDFESGDELLRKAGGSTDPATKQIKKLKSKTAFKSLSPLTPLPLPSVTVTNAIVESGKKKKDSDADARRLAAQNKRHADTALTAKNLKATTGRFSQTSNRVSRSILGAIRG